MLFLVNRVDFFLENGYLLIFTGLDFPQKKDVIELAGVVTNLQ
jgi:hypothetical protein